MNTLPLNGRVHATTVQALARGEVTVPRPRRRRTQQPRTITTRQVRVDPRVMAVARELAGGDVRRISITDEHEVIVLNHKRRK